MSPFEELSPLTVSFLLRYKSVSFSVSFLVLAALTMPPYEVSEAGWGEFYITARIFLIDETLPPVEMSHFLRVRQKETLNRQKETLSRQKEALSRQEETVKRQKETLAGLVSSSAAYGVYLSLYCLRVRTT